MAKKPITSLNDLFKEIYADNLKNMVPSGVSLMSLFNRENWTVDEWLKHNISETMAELHPNAKEAQRIKNSKLYKSLT